LIVVQLDAAPAHAKTVYGALQAVIPKGYASKGIWMGFGMSVSGSGFFPRSYIADHNRHEGAMPARHLLTMLQDPANDGAYMYQSDVVVAGFKGTTCFAKDFCLSAYQECGEPKGAVPKSAESGSW
jgi:hypothetical protein